MTLRAAEAPLALSGIQAPVSREVEQVLEHIRTVAASDFPLIDQVGSYLMRVPGKLLRPTLLLLSARATGALGGQAIPMGAAVEMVHLASLAHDDAVDHAALRRGRPTLNALWNHEVAVLMGDYLFSRAIIELADLGDIDALRVLSRAAAQMSAGEFREILSYDDLSYSRAEYLRMISAKTASLISAACQLGAIHTGGRHAESLGRYGHNLGMAFQIADDLLDYEGAQDVTGKPPGLDVQGRKVTLPLVGALRRMSDSEVEEVRSIFTLTRPDQAAARRVLELVRENGGLEYARAQSLAYADKAVAELEGLPPGRAVESLRGAAWYAVRRCR